MDTEKKLTEIFKAFENVVVAFSGGVDSTFLLAAAVRALGLQHVVAVTAVSGTLTDDEKYEALELGKSIGAKHVLLETAEMDDPAFTANDPQRCYYCKKIRFQSIAEWAAAHGIERVVEGSNADDLTDYRPGARAVAEIDAVCSPLQDAGITKAEIRKMSKRWNLPTAERLSNTCLATRLEYGLKLTPERMEQVAGAEAFLRPFCKGPLRVRHHGSLARIEVDPQYIPVLAKYAQQIDEKLKSFGFSHVALDLGGYQMGNMNKNLSAPENGLSVVPEQFAEGKD